MTMACLVQSVGSLKAESCVAGTTINYFLDGRINKAEVLFPGVGCFLIAAVLGSLVHSSNAADNQEKLAKSLADRHCTARYKFLFLFLLCKQL